MNRFALPAQAASDIKEIRRYIATDNVNAARYDADRIPLLIFGVVHGARDFAGLF